MGHPTKSVNAVPIDGRLDPFKKIGGDLRGGMCSVGYVVDLATCQYIPVIVFRVDEDRQ